MTTPMTGSLPGIYYDYIIPMGLYNLMVQTIGSNQANPNAPQIPMPTSSRMWLSQPRSGSDGTIEVVSVNFKVPVSISALAWDALQVGCEVQVWYVDTFGNSRPVLDQALNPITLYLTTAPTTTWYSASYTCYPFSASSLQFRIRRVYNSSVGTTPYVVGMRNALLQRHIYTRQDGVAAIESQQDSVGNTITSAIKDYAPTNAINNVSTNFWECFPQPSPNAVVNLYLDLRDSGGNAQMIDTLYIDPLYSGNNLNLYYSTDDTMGPLSLSAVSLAPTTNVNTNWSLGQGLWDTSASASTPSQYQVPFAWGPLVNQDAWVGIEWTPDFSPVSQNTVQLVTIMGNPAGGTFQLGYIGQWTTALPYDADGAAVQQALENTNIGTGNVSVIGAAGGPYTIIFQGTLAGQPIAPLTALDSLIGGTGENTADVGEPSPGSLTEIVIVTTQTGGVGGNPANDVVLFQAQTAGIDGADAVQTLSIASLDQTTTDTFPGWFTLSYDDTLSVPIPYNAAASGTPTAGQPPTIESALWGITPSSGPALNGNVSVSLQSDASYEWEIAFNSGHPHSGALAVQPVSMLEAVSYINGSSGSNSQLIAINGTPTGGTYTLSFPQAAAGIATLTTPAISVGASASSVQTALQSMVNIIPDENWINLIENQGSDLPSQTPPRAVTVKGPSTYTDAAGVTTTKYLVTFGSINGHVPLLVPDYGQSSTNTLTGGTEASVTTSYAAPVEVAMTSPGAVPITITNSGQYFPTIKYSTEGTFDLVLDNGSVPITFSCPISNVITASSEYAFGQNHPLNLVVGWSYENGGSVFIEAQTQGFTIATKTLSLGVTSSGTSPLPSNVSFDGTIGFTNFLGEFTAHVVKLENYADNYATFQANPQVYVSPPPVSPGGNGVIATTSLENAIFASAWLSQQYPSGGEDQSKYTAKSWTPIFANYVTKKGNLYLPSALNVKYLNLEFSNLTPAPYPVYDSDIPVTYQIFPLSVTSPPSSSLGQVGQLAGLLSLGADVVLSGTSSVNFLNPQSVNNAINAIYGQTYTPMAVSTINGTSTNNPALPNTVNSNLMSQSRTEVSTPWVYKRSPLNAAILAGNAILTAINSSTSGQTSGSQTVQTSLPPGTVDSNSGMTFTPTVTQGANPSSLPVQGDDWWIFPGGGMRMPAQVMNGLTGNTSVDLSAGQSTINWYRFNTPGVHQYQTVTAILDAAIAYYCGLREVQPYLSTFIDAQDPVTFSFSSYEPAQGWSLYNILTSDNTPVTDLSAPNGKPITTQGALYEIENPQFDPSQQDVIGPDEVFIDTAGGTNNVVSGWIQAQGTWSWSGTITIESPPVGSSFQLQIGDNNNQNLASTTFIDCFATAGEVEAAITTLGAVGTTNVQVTGEPGGPYGVSFSSTPADDELSITGVTSYLEGGTGPVVTVSTQTAGGGWKWDGTMGHWYLGAATATGNGTEQILLSSAVNVTSSATISVSAWTTWQNLVTTSSSVTVAGSPIQVQVWFYSLPEDAGSPGDPIDVNTITGSPVVLGLDPTQWISGTPTDVWPTACPIVTETVEVDGQPTVVSTGNYWQQITEQSSGNNTFTVPEGVNQMRIALVVTEAVTSGQVWFDTIEISGQTLLEGRASRIFTTFSNFYKLTCQFADSGTVRSDSMWEQSDPLDTNIPNTSLAYYTSLYPDIVPAGMWADTLGDWGDPRIVWGEPEAVVSVQMDPNMTFDGRRVLHFVRAAGAGVAGVQVTQTTNFVPNSLCRIGCVYFKPQQLSTANSVIYTVGQGQTMSSIALDFNISMAELQAANPDASPNQLYPGQQLILPTSATQEGSPDQIQVELTRVSDGLVVYSETFTPVEGFWYQYDTQFFEVPDSNDQVYNLTLYLTGSNADQLYLNDLWCEIANIRYFVTVGGAEEYMHDVTPLVYANGKAIVTAQGTPVNEFIVDAVILSPEAYAYSCQFTPTYLK